MPSLSSLSLQQQVSFLVRYLSAITFRDDGMPFTTGLPDDYVNTFAIAPLLNYADRLLISSELPTSETLHQTVKSLLSSSTSVPPPEPAAGILRGRVDDLVRRLDAVLAEAREGCWMPGEVERIFESLRKTIELRYVRSCRTFDNPPVVLLEFKDVHRHKGLEPTGHISISGACQFDDTDDLVSVVRLVVRDKGFDWPSACVLPYILAHELLCHAYQGTVRCDGAAVREITDPACVWSEGWMDVLALWLTEDWVQTGSEVPDWVRSSRTQVRSGCIRFHSERYGPQPNPLPAELRNRRSARGGVDALFEEYSALGVTDAREVVFAFSLTLNLSAMPQERRNDLVNVLALGLEVASEEDRDEILSAITDFPAHGDWEELEHRLRGAILSET